MSRRDDIIDAAGQLLERDGTEGLTMRAVAGELGIRAPSLYKHIADKRELEIAVVAAALEQQAEAFERVIANSGDPVRNRGCVPILGSRAPPPLHPHE